jgi:hypothetical protein
MLSLPFRIAVSMLVVSLAIPICVQSLCDGDLDISRKVATQIAQEISNTAREISLRPVGESRLMSLGDYLSQLDPGISLVIGSLLGEGNYSIIRCSDGRGWSRIVPVDLPPLVKGFCSSDSAALTIGRDSGNLLISHSRNQIGEIIQIGEL